MTWGTQEEAGSTEVLTPEVVAFSEALLALDNAAAAALLHDAADDQDALDRIVVPSLVQIGNGWTTGEVSLSLVYMSGRMCQQLVEQVFPTAQHDRGSALRLAAGVLGDGHVLGKQMVVHLLRSSGYEVADWGLRLTVDEIVDRVAEEDIDVLMLSVLMLRSALRITELREQLRVAALNPVIVVGGAPFRFDTGLGAEVGADYVGASATDVLAIMADIEARRRREAS